MIKCEIHQDQPHHCLNGNMPIVDHNRSRDDLTGNSNRHRIPVTFARRFHHGRKYAETTQLIFEHEDRDLPVVPSDWITISKKWCQSHAYHPKMTRQLTSETQCRVDKPARVMCEGSRDWEHRYHLTLETHKTKVASLLDSSYERCRNVRSYQCYCHRINHDSPARR